MAKVAFSKLGLKQNNEVKILHYNEQDIEIRQYVPMQEKADMISKIINYSSDENGYYNPLSIKVFLTLEILYTYTNLTFTEKMKENEMKLFDIVTGSGFFNEIINNIPKSEWEDIQTTIWDTISNIYEYKNSAMGILDAIQTDYNNLSLDANALAEKVLDPESLSTLKELIPLV